MISDPRFAMMLNRRISAVARPGSLLKHVQVQPRAHVKEAAGTDAAYLAQVRQLPCLKCGDQPCGEAAHVRFASAAFGKRSGMGKKPSDSDAVPLCPACHRLDRDAQHNRNERDFWNAVGLNPLLVAQRLYAARGDLVAMENIIRIAIAERKR